MADEATDLINRQDKYRHAGTKNEFSALLSRSNFGFNTPLSWRWFIGVIGSEYCHTYFWIAKDLFWMQGLRDFSILFGLLALAWSLVVLYHAIRTVNWNEIWNFVALFLWLFANFVWMRGEAHDHEYPEEIPIAVECSDISAIILLFAFSWLLLYYLVCLPLNLIHTSKTSLFEYDDGSLRPRCSVFRNFRQYENLHMLFWIAKDLAWNRLQLLPWMICVFPTLMISADLLYISVSTSDGGDYLVDVAHFLVTFLWVFANSVWAFGDFFIEKYNEPLGIWDQSEETLMTARWYSAWILFFDIAVICVMYGMWITLTVVGRLNATTALSSGGNSLHQQATTAIAASTSGFSYPSSGTSTAVRSDSGDVTPHAGLSHNKYSLTGLNLTSGNGILSFEPGGIFTSHIPQSSPAGSAVQRTNSGGAPTLSGMEMMNVSIHPNK